MARSFFRSSKHKPHAIFASAHGAWIAVFVIYGEVGWDADIWLGLAC